MRNTQARFILYVTNKRGGRIIMEEEKAVSLAKEIIELDIKRDEMLETFMQLAGEQAFQLLRSVQNGQYRKSS